MTGKLISLHIWNIFINYLKAKMGLSMMDVLGVLIFRLEKDQYNIENDCSPSHLF